MGPGNVLVLEDGEDVKFGEPNIPTAGFESFIKTLSKLCGAAMEMPYDVLIKEFNSSYSSAKGALEEAWETIKMRRAHLVSDFCKPVYEMWLAEAVASGRINAPGFFADPLIRKAWCGARWDGPAQIHLDPTKEAEANEKAVAHGWKTNEQIAREQYGTDWRSNAERLKQENELMAQVNPAPTIEKGDDDNAEDA
jgi:capsid protein